MLQQVWIYPLWEYQHKQKKEKETLSWARIRKDNGFSLWLDGQLQEYLKYVDLNDRNIIKRKTKSAAAELLSLAQFPKRTRPPIGWPPLYSRHHRSSVRAHKYNPRKKMKMKIQETARKKEINQTNEKTNEKKRERESVILISQFSQSTAKTKKKIKPKERCFIGPPPSLSRSLPISQLNHINNRKPASTSNKSQASQQPFFWSTSNFYGQMGFRILLASFPHSLQI